MKEDIDWKTYRRTSSTSGTIVTTGTLQNTEFYINNIIRTLANSCVSAFTELCIQDKTVVVDRL